MIIGRKDKDRLAKLEEQVASLSVKAEGTGDTEPTRSFDFLTELMGAAATASGKVVTPETAMKAAVVFACTRLLSEAMAGLPLDIFERQDDGTAKLADKSVANGIWWLLNESPTPLCTAAAWREWMVRDALLKGDGISIIGRKGASVDQLIPVDRNNVLIERTPKVNRLRYYVNTDHGYFGFDQDDVLHFPGFGFNGINGMSVIKYAANQAIGIALSAEEFAAKFFANGATPRFSLEVPGVLKEKQVEELRAEWVKRYTGVDNQHLPLILMNGAKAAQLTVNAEDAQLLETRMFEVVDICRAFGVPPHMVGETDKTTAWGTGIEQMGLGFVRYSLRGFKNRTEQEMNRKFWPRSQKYFVAHDLDSLMSGDMAAEASYFRNALGGAQGPGWMKVNEVRRKKNLSPEPGGEKLYIPPPQKTGGNNEPGDAQSDQGADGNAGGTNDG